MRMIKKVQITIKRERAATAAKMIMAIKGHKRLVIVWDCKYRLRMPSSWVFLKLFQ